MFYVFLIFSTAVASLQLVPYPLANFKSLPKFFFSITLKEHLEAQLRHTEGVRKVLKVLLRHLPPFEGGKGGC